MASATTITCLSVRQPWSDLIIHGHPALGVKPFENRSWRYPPKYRGPLFIHASRWEPQPDDDDYCDWRTNGDGITGAIIGVVDLVAAANLRDMDEVHGVLSGQSRRTLTADQQALLPLLPNPRTKAGGLAWDYWTCDRTTLILANPRPLVNPIPIGGRLNLWRTEVEPKRLKFCR
jgi:hypothetical protein